MTIPDIMWQKALAGDVFSVIWCVAVLSVFVCMLFCLAVVVFCCKQKD